LKDTRIFGCIIFWQALNLSPFYYSNDFKIDNFNHFHHQIMKYLVTILMLFLIFATAKAQYYTIEGRIFSQKDSLALPGASVIVVGRDSSKLAAPSKMDGNFKINGLSNGTYQLKVSFMGFQSLAKPIRISNQSLNLGNIYLAEQDKNLKEVQVVGQVVTGSQKGDTTEFNTNAFKTNPDATAEDLVQKLPGVSMQNGKIQAHGEDVKKILVDGKPFFGDDPSAALKNLPSEVIDKVQVFDQLSDQSQYTGFDDGNTQKTINLITKQNKRSGKFGKIYAGYGVDNMYEAGFSVNAFKGDRRITLLGQSNNTNKQNFGIDDIMGVMSSGGRGGGGGGRGGGIGDFMVGQSSGVTKTHALGINYSDKWTPKIEVSGSYFFNYGDNTVDQSTLKQYFASEVIGKADNQSSNADKINMNHRANLKFEYKIDSVNSLMFRTRMSYQKNNSNNAIYGESLYDLVKTYLTNNVYGSDGDGLNLSGELNFRHRFAKKGRSISLEFSPSYSNRYSDGDRMYYKVNGTAIDTLENENQINNSKRDARGFGTSLAYTEPVGAKGQLLFNYRYSYNTNNSDKEYWALNEATNLYSLKDTLLTNSFDNDFLSHSFGATYRYVNGSYQFTLGANYQFSDQQNQQVFPDTNLLSQYVKKFQPEASFTYKPNKTTNLRINYRSSTNAPSIDKLQNVVDNTNLMAITVGNPDLKPSTQHNLSARFSIFKPEKSTNLMLFLNGSFINNYITNNTLLAPVNRDTVFFQNIAVGKGAQLTRPENIDGYFTLRSFLGFGVPVKALKTNVNINANVSYTQTPTFFNNKKYFSNAESYGGGIVLSSNISESIDFTLSSFGSYNFVKNSSNGGESLAEDNKYYSINSSARLNLMFLNGFVYRADLTHTYYNGLTAGYNQDYIMLNMSIARKVFKNKSGELKLSVNDLLKQNQSVTRTYSDFYYEDVRSNVVGRYYLLTFTYTIKAFGQQEQRRRQFGPGGPGFGPGGPGGFGGPGMMPN
jgi:hypothetical protein